MVVQSCPECGLKVTDEQENCPKCQTAIPKEITDENMLVVGKALASEKKNTVKKKKKAAKEKPTDAPLPEVEAAVKKDDTSAMEDSKTVATEVTVNEDATPKKKKTKKAAPKKSEAESKVVAPAEEKSASDEKKAAPKRRTRRKKTTVPCPQCSADVLEEQNFCGVCGTAVGAIEAHETVTVLTDEEDRKEHKAIAAIAYILIFIPFLTGDFKKSKFVRFHTNQALALLVSSISFVLVISLFTQIMNMLFFPNTIAILIDGTHAISSYGFHGAPLYWQYLSLILGLAHLLPFAFMFIGMKKAAGEKEETLPIIGKWFKFLK